MSSSRVSETKVSVALQDPNLVGSEPMERPGHRPGKMRGRGLGGHIHSTQSNIPGPIDVIINSPDVVAEVTTVFHQYEGALLANNVEALDTFFVHSPAPIRYGVAEIQHGIEELRAFRSSQKPFKRRLSHTVVTAYGNDVAVASTLFHRDDYPGQTGRQMQMWVRTPEGWKVAAAHVSMMAGG